ncbi:hypothetical protein [Nitratiruptor sp. YY09-18]|uniref:hypothetical protein n=1 Tax=Nitratiruptor sp. YY09-18 TaxID=2724901 RepID=UPI0019152C76|nr:hypothetical protein [Nitratiruptor sp. YY09-18]BCD67719.1 hypothetical protein NitYY0918_C0620 [Nitratiruptor sp. YY09-18]
MADFFVENVVKSYRANEHPSYRLWQEKRKKRKKQNISSYKKKKRKKHLIDIYA